MATIAPPKVTTPQQMIRAWIREYAAARPVVENDELLEDARARFADDDVFRDALMDYALDEMVTDEARKVFHSGRVKMGSAHWTREEFEQRADDRWSRWRESDGVGKRLRLLDMTKADLLATADEREKRAAGEMSKASFLRELASKMRGKQTVSERFPHTAELDAIYDRIHKTTKGATA